MASSVPPSIFIDRYVEGKREVNGKKQKKELVEFSIQDIGREISV